VTHFPCLPCTKSIIQAGIERVYYATDYKNNPYAQGLFEKAGVEVVHVPFDERKIDFLSDEKLALYIDMLNELRESGMSAEKLRPYEQKVSALFGKNL